VELPSRSAGEGEGETDDAQPLVVLLVLDEAGELLSLS